MRLFDLYENVVEELRQDPAFVRVRAVCREGLRLTSIKRLEGAHDTQLSESLREFYSAMNGWHVSWICDRTDEDRAPVFGRTEIPDLEKLLKREIEMWRDGAWTGVPIRKRLESAVDVLDLDTLVMLDKLSAYEYVLADPESPTADLYLSRFTDVTPLGLSFEDYVVLALESRGTYCWQEHVQRSEVARWDPYVPDHLQENLMALFPGTDTSRFTGCPDAGPETSYDRFYASSGKRELADGIETEIRALQDDERMSSVRSEFGVPCSLSVFRRVAHTLGREVPEYVYRFYGVADGLKAEWECRTSEREVFGQINLFPLVYTFGGYRGESREVWDDDVFEDVLWAQSDAEEDVDLEMLKRLRPIDGYDGASFFVCLRLDEASFDSPLYLWYRKDIFELPVNLREYFGLVETSMGTAQWQMLLLNESDTQQLNITVGHIAADVEAVRGRAALEEILSRR